MSTTFERALTVKEFSAYLGVSIPTVYSEIRRGRLIASKVGARSVILPKNADAYLENLDSLEVA